MTYFRPIQPNDRIRRELAAAVLMDRPEHAPWYFIPPASVGVVPTRVGCGCTRAGAVRTVDLVPQVLRFLGRGQQSATCWAGQCSSR